MINFKKREIKEVVSASNLKQKSINALDTFQRVLQDLRGINEESKAKQDELVIEAAKINVEISELESVSLANAKVIANIEKSILMK
jgi:hypothetical protein